MRAGGSVPDKLTRDNGAAAGGADNPDTRARCRYFCVQADALGSASRLAKRTPSYTCEADSFAHLRSGLLRTPTQRTPSQTCETDSFVQLRGGLLRTPAKNKKQKNSSRARQWDGGYGPSGPPWGPSKNSWVWCPRLSSRVHWRKVNGEARRPAPGWTPPGGPH